MYTHCPNCDTHFEISQEYLDIANGKVRCGKCDHIFNALDNLYEKKTEASDSAPTEQLSQLQNNLSDNINQLSTSPEEAETIETPPPSTFKDAATDLPGNSIERSNNEGFSIGGISSKSSGSDIKEKMERIAASLSAATAELKNARKSTTFHKHSTDSILSQETIEPAESSEIQETIEPEESLENQETIEPEESLEIQETVEPAESSEIQETIEPEESSEIQETIEPEESFETQETIEPEESLEIQETIEPEESFETQETIEPEESLEIQETVEPAKSSEIQETVEPAESLEIQETIEPEESLEIQETVEPAESLEIQETIKPEESLEIQETAVPAESLETIESEDELDLVDFDLKEFDDPNPSLMQKHATHKVDDGDMDILNSLIDGNTQASSDNELLDELDDINKTLSDSSDSLDDELSRLGNDFDDLDSGDDLLAELEQLESDFLNNDKKSPVHSTDSSIQAGGSLHADGSLHAKGSLHAEGSSLDDMFASSDTGSGQLDNSVTAVTDLDESTQKNQEQFSSTTKANEVQDEVVPSFLTQSDSTNTNPGAMLAWLAGSIILLLLLSAQYLHVNSSKFAQNPNVRPLLETLCPITNCSLPLTKTPRKIVTVNHDVRSHPTVNNALEIQLAFKNKANYTQGYPILEITFSNPLGEVIARRKFSPEEYLTGDIQYARGMKAQQSQEINLKIVDPDPGSLLSFQFNYL